MPRRRTSADEAKPSAPTQKKRAPARSLEARENQLIAMAYDYAEDAFKNKTASSQITTEFLKRGSTKERLEKEILERNKELLTAKTDAIKSAKTVEELYANALDAMRRYTGSGPSEEYND